jgi:GTP-binding protein
MLEWCRADALSVHLLLTKTDKVSRSAALQTGRAIERDLARAGLEASWQLFSAPKGTGVEEAQARLDRWLETTLDEDTKERPRNQGGEVSGA